MSRPPHPWTGGDQPPQPPDDPTPTIPAGVFASKVSSPHLLISVPPPVRSVLCIQNLIRLESPEPPPNLWWRFWFWFLLGWRWEKRP
jgi:hypothetical protein